MEHPATENEPEDNDDDALLAMNRISLSELPPEGWALPHLVFNAEVVA